MVRYSGTENLSPLHYPALKISIKYLNKSNADYEKCDKL